MMKQKEVGSEEKAVVTKVWVLTAVEMKAVWREREGVKNE